MVKWTTIKIKKCPTCGTLLDSRSRVKNEIKRADEVLKIYYNKLRKKNEK